MKKVYRPLRSVTRANHHKTIVLVIDQSISINRTNRGRDITRSRAKKRSIVVHIIPKMIGSTVQFVQTTHPSISLVQLIHLMPLHRIFIQSVPLNITQSTKDTLTTPRFYITVRLFTARLVYVMAWHCHSNLITDFAQEKEIRTSWKTFMRLTGTRPALNGCRSSSSSSMFSENGITILIERLRIGCFSSVSYLGFGL